MSTDRRTVIDANAAIAAVDAGVLDNLARASVLCAPSLFWIECCSVLHRRMRLRRVAEGPELEAFDRIAAAAIDPIRPDDHRAPWDIASRLGWQKTHDAEYLAAARYVDGQLLTLDRRLADGARRLGIPVVVPD